MSLSDLPGPVPDPAVVRGGTTALAEPVSRVRPLWVTGIVLVNLGINAAFFGPLQVLLGSAGSSLRRRPERSDPCFGYGLWCGRFHGGKPALRGVQRPHYVPVWSPCSLGPDGRHPGSCCARCFGRCSQRCSNDFAVVRCAGWSQRHVRRYHGRHTGPRPGSTARNCGRTGRHGTNGRNSGRRRNRCGSCRELCRRLLAMRSSIARRRRALSLQE